MSLSEGLCFSADIIKAAFIKGCNQIPLQLITNLIKNTNNQGSSHLVNMFRVFISVFMSRHSCPMCSWNVRKMLTLWYSSVLISMGMKSKTEDSKAAAAVWEDTLQWFRHVSVGFCCQEICFMPVSRWKVKKQNNCSNWFSERWELP